MLAVGFKNINEVIIREKVLFGGEESGGFGIVDFLPERDGNYTSLPTHLPTNPQRP